MSPRGPRPAPCALALVAAGVFLFPAPCRPMVRIGGGQARVVIVADKADWGRVGPLAEILSGYLGRATGAVLSVSWTAPEDRTVRIHLRLENPPEAPGDALAQLAADQRFTIDVDGERTVAISGGGELGLEYGIYEFLERFVGVRWLYPGPLGEHVPRHDGLDLPAAHVAGGPAFVARRLSGLRGQEETVWARRNRALAGGLEFHHNLANLFPPEKYAEAHPEFYPLVDGKRRIPAPGEMVNWQPCFTAPGLVEEAVASIVAYLDAHPGTRSYSLGVNDSSGYCECATCAARSGTKLNFYGKQSYSEPYYAWVNAVAAGVLEKHPDVWFGCLAHGRVADPPEGFSLHPRVVPFLTYDRYKWVNPELEAKLKQLNAAWERRAANLGWYDYIYGKFYVVPRVYFGVMRDYLRYAREHRVRALYAEAYPGWHEGPKLYLALRLQWDPDQDAAAILDDWYRTAVGPAAAPHLAEYFAFWERYWTERVPSSVWFTNPTTFDGTYLPHQDRRYLDGLTPADLERCRGLLEQALAKAATPAQKARAGFFADGFARIAAEVAKSR